MGRALLTLIFAAFLIAGLASMPQPAAANDKYASYILDATTGEVLHDASGSARRYPASLTKMMTLYLLFEDLERGRVTMDTKMRVSSHAAGRPPSKLGLPVGQTIRVRDAIPALIIKSANDVASVVAEHLGGTESEFAQRMTQKARALGMAGTTFRNASGLPHSGQVSTARDMAQLGRALFRDFPSRMPLFAQSSFKYNGRTYGTHNRVIARIKGADGMKTGYIRASGFNVVTSVLHKGHRLIAVVMGGRSSRSRDDHMVDLVARVTPQLKPVAPGRRPVLLTNIPLPRPRPGVMALAAAGGTEALERKLEAQKDDAIGTLLAGLPAAPKAPQPAFRPQVEGSADGGLGLIASANAAQLPLRTQKSGDLELAALTKADAAPLPPPNPKTRLLSSGKAANDNIGFWSVQVGAFFDETQAETMAQNAVAALGDKFRHAVVAIPHSTMKDGRKLYRARLNLGEEKEAEAACKALRRADTDCFAVQHEPLTNVAEQAAGADT